MKLTHIVGLVMVVAAIGIFVSMSGDATTYSDFAYAESSQKVVKIAGELAKDKEIYYNPQENPNYLSFYVRDDAGQARKVVLNAAKPQDFEQSEKVVLTGQMNGSEFHASDMLMKCPSKYKDEEIYIESKEKDVG